MTTLYKEVRVPSDIGAASEADLLALQEAVDALAYVAPQVTSFTNSVNTVEMGSTVSSVTFNWAVNKTVASQSIDQSVGSISPPTTTKTKTGLSIASATTFTLTVDDGTSYAGHQATRTTVISFLNSFYWGISAAADLASTPAVILTLAHADLATSRAKSVTIDGGGKFIYFCYPSIWGAAAFTVNGLPNTAWTPSVVQSFTNGSGCSVYDYNVYRSNTVQNGTGLSIVIS